MAKHQAKHSAQVSKSAKKQRGASPKGRRSRGAKVAVGVAVVLVLASGGVYASGAYYFQGHFMPNTTLNGRDVSWLSKEEAAQQIDDAAASYQNTLTAGDFSFTVNSHDIDLKSDGESCVGNALAKANVYLWPYEVTRPHAYHEGEGISYDEEKLSALVGQALDDYNASATKPQDAAITFDSQNKSYVVTPEVDGNQVVKDVVLQQALDGVATMQAETTVDDSAKVTASVRGDDEALNQAVSSANAVLDQAIPVVDANDKTVATVTKDQLVNWVTLGEDKTVSVDSAAVGEWVKANLTSAVPAEDDNFKYSLDSADTTSALVSSIKAGSSASTQVYVSKKSKPRQVKSSAAGAPAGTYDPALGSYIDVDLGNQYARYFGADGSVLWESPVVSGNTSEGRSTPTGTYSINSKATNVTLTGADEDHDGEPDYKSKVTYWMPFVGNSVGLHDATWRSSFGGFIYASSGSHGCVNLPYGKAESLYKMVSVGTTVHVHW